MTNTIYIIRDREAGNYIEDFNSMEEAKTALAEYEEQDKADGSYSPDFYEIVERRIIPFTNMDASPMSMNVPISEQALREKIEREYTEAAIECAAEFEKRVAKKTAKTGQGYYGTAIIAAMRETPRYAYIKDEKFDIEIDLLAHTYCRRPHLG